MDTHTAVAWRVAEGYESERPVVVLSTASPYKFPAAVLDAIGGDTAGSEFDQMRRLHERTGVPVPAGLAALEEKPRKHFNVIDCGAMQDFVLRKVSRWEA